MNMKAQTMARTALFTAIIAVLSQVSVPMPSGVPITLQTFAIALAGYCLGAKYGTAATVVYIALGAVGVPVFTGFTAGFSRLFGVTGGFIWGFIPMAALCGLCHGRRGMRAYLPGIAGVVVCHLLGAAQYAVLAQISFVRALLLVSLPYIAKDLLMLLPARAADAALGRAMGTARV